uniref:Putative microtubule-associated protein futsch n=3 Tax=Ixodes ricinus TaxID=34613 RepID=A0A131XSG6_IXORI
MMSQDHLLKLDAVLSSEQMRALLQDAGGPHSHSDKLDFDVLGNVGGAEDGSHPLAAIEDSLHDLENLVLEQGSASGGLFTETTDADVEALLKATLGAEDLLSPMELVFLDHCYSMPLGAVPVGEGVGLTEEHAHHAAQQDVRDCTSPSEDVDSEEAHSFGASSPGSPQLPLRRSQRQIERIDRERLERIKAENAELKRKEQEEMGRGQGAGPVAPAVPEEAGTPPQAPPPMLASVPPVVAVVAAQPVPVATPAAVAVPVTAPVTSPVALPVPVAVASPLHQPVLASPSPAKDKVPKVLALPAQPSPAKRSKPRNSESFSSDGTLEDVSLSSPSHGAEEAAARPRKKRQRSHDLDEIARDVAKLHEAPAKKGVAKKGAEPAAKGPSKKDAKRAAIKEESRGEGAGLKRKAEEAEKAEKEGKKKPLPQEVSPFGKVVKVVRTTPEVKKKPRRESFTDEPALFSQPDVLIKEHEPHLGPNPPSTPTPGPLPNPPQAGEKDIHMEESSYDTVEAHVARLAGGDHGPPPASTTVPVVPATVVATAPAPAPAPALAPALAPASALPVAHPPKPTLAMHTPKASPKPAQPPKISFPAAVQKKPNAAAPKPGQGPERKRPLAIAIKSAPPPLPSQAKPKPTEHPATPTHPHVSPAHPKPAKATKGGEGVVKGAGHPKKGAEQQVKKVKVPKPEPPPPFPPVAERPKRQSKEKFKRAMMRKREMGRRVDDEDVDDSSEEQHGSDWSSEDDPEKLWCICRQPHNDKFMIQCDKCEDWFHGTCVGVTRQQGRLWEKENREWMCPKCAKALGVESFTPAPAKEEAQQPPDWKSHPKASPKAETPVKLAPKGVLRECLVCKRRTECVGLYCGRDCIAKYVNDASQTIKAAKLDGERRLMFTERSSGKLVAGVQTPTPDKLTDWLVRNPTYELAVARTPSRPPSQKPPQPKTTPAKVPTPAKAPTPAKTPTPAKPAKQPTPQSTHVVVQTTVAAAAAPSVAGAVPVGTAPAENVVAAATPEVKKQPPPQPEIEPVRINVRKVLRDSLSNRCKDADDISLSGDEVKRMAVRIEEELFKYFKDTGTKYKSKYRSLVFNIKDTRNQGLFRKILKGKIAPDKLVRMTPEELASKELAKWRERENQHTLEMIKKEQMEAAQNVTSHALIKKTHKGEVEIDDDNLRLLEKADEKSTAEQPEPVVTTTPRVSTGGSTGSAILDAAERPGRDTTDAHRSHLFDLNCKICTGKVAPPPLPTTSTDEVPAASASPQHRRRGSATPADAGGDLSSSSSSSSSASSSAHASPPPPPPPTRDGATSSRSNTPPPPPPPPSSHSEKKGKKSASRRSRDDSSDLEPSSTVSLGSPDSGISGSRGSQGGKGPSSVWKGFISMQEVSKFVTSAYKVSGPTDFLSQDIPDTINVCGRIIPDQVWDYLSKIKQSGNKELLVIRFQPANEEEKKPYRELYGYLNSRKRCGVVGGLSRMLKDFYILPLPSHSPVPTVLMPFEGPGLMSGRPHMLLGIIVRHKNRPKGTGKGSRASWAERSSSLDAASYTPPPPETTPSGGNSDDEEPYEPSYTPPLEKRRSRRKGEELHPEDDDDVPYDPEDNDVGFGPAGSGSGASEAPPPAGGATEVTPRVGGAGSLVSGQTVSELIERISAGANPAEVTTSVLASIATNSDLEHQKRLLVELTQEVEEQKRLIELQRLQAITMVMNKAGPAASGPSQTSKTSDASGIPFLDSSLPMDTGLSFLSGGSAPTAGSAPAAGSTSCSLPSTLQELLNKVKAPPAPSSTVAPPPGPAPSVGALLASVAAIPSPPQQPSAKKPIAEDPIVKHFAGDATPESDSEALAAGETPPPPGESVDDAVIAALAAPAGAAAVTSRSPGTPTKDELIVEEARPQDPRRRKAAGAAAAPTLAPAIPVVAPTPPLPTSAAGTSATTGSTGSKLGAKSASELMEMARKQLEEMEGVAMSPSMPVAPPAPAPMFVQPPPTVPVAPPMMGAPPPGMYGPPPPMDGGFVPPPPQGMGFPPDPQWGPAGGPPGYWKGPPPSVPPPPPPTGWNGGGRGDYRQRGGDWRSGGGRRSQWDQRR